MLALLFTAMVFRRLDFDHNCSLQPTICCCFQYIKLQTHLLVPPPRCRCAYSTVLYKSSGRSANSVFGSLTDSQMPALPRMKHNRLYAVELVFGCPFLPVWPFPVLSTGLLSLVVFLELVQLVLVVLLYPGGSPALPGRIPSVW